MVSTKRIMMALLVLGLCVLWTQRDRLLFTEQFLQAKSVLERAKAGDKLSVEELIGAAKSYRSEAIRLNEAFNGYVPISDRFVSETFLYGEAARQGSLEGANAYRELIAFGGWYRLEYADVIAQCLLDHQDKPEAAAGLGELFFYGTASFPPSPNRAVPFLLQAASRGHKEVYPLLSKLCLDHNCMVDAYAWNLLVNDRYALSVDVSPIPKDKIRGNHKADVFWEGLRGNQAPVYHFEPACALSSIQPTFSSLN